MSGTLILRTMVLDLVLVLKRPSLQQHSRNYFSNAMEIGSRLLQTMLQWFLADRFLTGNERSTSTFTMSAAALGCCC